MTAISLLRRQVGELTGTTLRRGFSSSRTIQTTYGFIGLGRMGFPMARNLRAKLSTSDKLVVFDKNEDAMSRFSKENEGIEVASSVREVAEKSETIITVLPEPSHVQNVYQSMLKPPTLLKDGIGQKRLFIDCSTIDLSTSKSVANAAHSSSQGKFVDAPMSGGVVGAEAGKLTFMIGASQELVDRATEVLSLMGKRVLHLGPQTSGLKGKLANNYLLAINNVATAEAMNMGVQWGLDPVALADMINTSTGKCWPSEVNNPVPGVISSSPASNGYAGGFGTALANKDLKLAMQAAEEIGIKPVLGPLVRDVYQDIEDSDELKNKDFSVVYKHIGGK